jgi:hypothetical protein
MRDVESKAHTNGSTLLVSSKINVISTPIRWRNDLLTASASRKMDMELMHRSGYCFTMAEKRPRPGFSWGSRGLCAAAGMGYYTWELQGQH